MWKPALLWNLEDVPPSVSLWPPSNVCAVLSVGFSPNGRIGVMVGSSGIIKLWDAFTGLQIADLVGSGPSNTVDCAAFNPNGRWLATGGNLLDVAVRGEVHGQVWFWDTLEAKPIGGPIRFPHPVNHIAYCKDGRRLVACWGTNPPDYGGAQVLDASTRRSVGPPIHHRGGVTQASFSPDGERLLTAFADAGLGACEAQVWNPLTGVPVAPPIKHRDGVSAASFSPDGKWVVTASEDTTARVWNSFTSEPRTPPFQHGAAVQWAEFSPDGRLVLTASMDRTARVWDASTGQPVTPPLRHDGPVWHAVFSKDGRKIVTASEDRTARIWKLLKDERSASELLKRAELLAAHKIDPTGGLVPLDLPAIRARWVNLRAK